MILQNRELKNALIKIGVPVALQNMLTSLLNMIDTVMIGSLGDRAVAAVGLANQWFFIMNLVLFGIVSGSSIYVSQYYGKGDFKTMQIPIAYSLVLCTGVSVIFAGLSFFTPDFVMRLFTNDPETVAVGADYLRVASLSYLMIAFSLPLATAMRAVDAAVVPLIVTGSALLINTGLNYTLINGHFGAPSLGVVGAAIATSTARVVETLAIYILVLAKKTKIRLKPKYFKFKSDFAKVYLKTIAPVIGNESMWGLGISMYNIMFGHTNNVIVAANQISRNLEQITIALSIGVGSAAAVVIGRKIGEQRTKEAFAYAKKFAKASVVMGAVLGVIMLAAMPLYVDMYSVSNEAKEYSRMIIIAFGVFMPMKMYNYMNIVGVLRSGGDTAFCFWLDTCSVWLVGVVSVYLALFVFKAPFWIVAICLVLEEAVKAVVGFARFRSQKWLNDLVN